VALIRVALVPWSSEAFSEASGAALISISALASSALLFGQRRPDGSRRHRLLAAAFPIAAVAAVAYAWAVSSGGAPWAGVFVWLMTGILLSGMQVVSLVQRIAERAESERAILASLIESSP